MYQYPRAPPRYATHPMMVRKPHTRYLSAVVAGLMGFTAMPNLGSVQLADATGPGSSVFIERFIFGRLSG